jgi:hypothetical protein
MILLAFRPASCATCNAAGNCGRGGGCTREAEGRSLFLFVSERGSPMTVSSFPEADGPGY